MLLGPLPFSQAPLGGPISIPTFSYFRLNLLTEDEKQEKWERELVLHGATHPGAQRGVGILGRKDQREGAWHHILLIHP